MMIHKHELSKLIALILWPNIAMGAADYTARIHTVQQQESLHIAAAVTARNAGRLHYRLTVHKQGRSGQSHTRQEGAVYAKAKEETILAKAGLNLQPDDDCTIDLEILIDNQRVAGDQWRCKTSEGSAAP